MLFALQEVILLCYFRITGTKPALCTANSLCPAHLITAHSFVHQCLHTLFFVHRQPVSCCACPQCSVSTDSLYPAVPAHNVLCPQTACILLCLPTVFCVHRQPVSCCAYPQCPVSTDSLYPAVPAHSVLCLQAACILCTVRH